VKHVSGYAVVVSKARHQFACKIIALMLPDIAIHSTMHGIHGQPACMNAC
jgi:hypothetical protein